ncbi:MAG: hypothetical protein OEY51_10020 [Cyclobacteriaceae bacterium]|nr:hypothetical protein [Cyclobacteriaceae bacterium]
MKFLFVIPIFFFSCLLPTHVNGQTLKNLKKGGQLLKKVLTDEPESTSEDTSEENDDRSVSTGSSRGEDRTRKFDAPDINKNIDEAIDSYQSDHYSASRYATQQALVGVQLEIGKELLTILPKSVKNIEYNPDEDNVMSVGSGFIGMEINRQYENDMNRINLHIVSNNNLVMSGARASLASVSMASDDDYKVITVQGYKVLLEIEEDAFQITIPLGETTLFGLNCNACQTEVDVTEAINTFNLKEIETTLEN